MSTIAAISQARPLKTFIPISLLTLTLFDSITVRCDGNPLIRLPQLPNQWKITESLYYKQYLYASTDESYYDKQCTEVRITDEGRKEEPNTQWQCRQYTHMSIGVLFEDRTNTIEKVWALCSYRDHVTLKYILHDYGTTSQGKKKYMLVGDVTRSVVTDIVHLAYKSMLLIDTGDKWLVVVLTGYGSASLPFERPGRISDYTKPITLGDPVGISSGPDKPYKPDFTVTFCADSESRMKTKYLQQLEEAKGLFGQIVLGLDEALWAVAVEPAEGAVHGGTGKKPPPVRPPPPTEKDLPLLPIAIGTGMTLAVLGAAKKLLAKSKAAKKPQAQEKAEKRDKKKEVVGYVLQLSSDRLEVAVGRPAPLRVNVWKVDGWGTPTLATDASIRITPQGNIPGLTIQPLAGSGGTLMATATLQQAVTAEPIELRIEASTPTGGHPARASVVVSESFVLSIETESIPA